MMDHFIMMDRSRDLSTIEKTFAQGRIMHLQSIFHYGDFINATIREWQIETLPSLTFFSVHMENIS